jgi:phage repressor protein C with HTH and peptisase S24 domain
VDAALVRQQYPSAFAMRVDGESMMPRFRHGDVVIAIAGLPVRDGEAALVKIRGRVGVTLKLVRREETTVHLIPINEKYDTERLPETEIEWLAPVLLAARFAAGR